MYRRSVKSMVQLVLIAAVLFLVLTGMNWLNAQNIKPELYKQLKFRFIGPQGNRVIKKNLPDFEDLLKEKNIPHVIIK